MNTKAIFLDLDGTLLNDEKQITPGNRAAIEKALAKGHRVIINTGRPLVSAIKLAKRLDLARPGCYCVAFNGGIIYDFTDEKIIYKCTIPARFYKAISEEASKRGLHLQAYDDIDVLVTPENDDDWITYYCNKILVTYHVIPSYAALPEESVKFLAIDADHEKNESFRRWIASSFAGEIDAFFSCNTYLEIVKAGLNKGNALKSLSSLLGIPIPNTIACGDESNDIAMIQAAGLGVAMSNGTPETKAVAGYITEHDNNHDGIAEVIEKFML